MGKDAAVIDYSDPGSIEGRLVGFDVGSTALDSVHQSWLDNHVVPVLKARGTVALTGLTSRTGTAAFNWELSQQRADAVLRHLVLNVGPVLHNIGVASVVGAGETLAEQDEQKDGTENPFYRAVIVLAWHRPMPPPPPKPKPKVETPLVKRVTSRKWNKFNSRMQGESAEAGMEFGNLAGDVLEGVNNKGSDARTYAMIPADQVVTHVYEDYIVEDDLGIGVNTTTYKKTVTYRWGPPSSKVFLRKRSKLVQNGRDYGWETKEGYHSRSEIWRHTTGPDSRVFW